MKYFLSGTGTDVGKTVVAAWLCLHLNCAYWKPIQCGLDAAGLGDRERVAASAGVATFPDGVRLAAARSPHVAAASAGRSLSLEDLRPPKCERLIVEGAGGVLVPIREPDVLMIDLIRELGYQTLIVAPAGLGGINHALLTIEALRARSLPIVGVMLNGALLPENATAITAFSGVPVLGHLPQLDVVTPQTLAAVPLPEALRERANIA